MSHPCLGFRLGSLCALGLALAAAPLAAVQAGTGYDARARGLTRSHYYGCLQHAGPDGQPRPCLEIVKAVDFSVNPFLFPLNSAEFGAAFDARWGRPDSSRTPPDPGAYRRKKWAFLDNERGGLARVALEWACRQRPDLLRITPGAWTCQPTELEELDFKAVYDIDLLRAYFDAEVAGARPDRPQEVNLPGRPCRYDEADVWWFGWTIFYKNVGCDNGGSGGSGGSGGTGGSGGSGGSGGAGGGSEGEEAVKTLEELRRRLRELLQWLDRQLPPPQPSTARVTLGVVPGP